MFVFLLPWLKEKPLGVVYTFWKWSLVLFLFSQLSMAQVQILDTNRFLSDAYTFDQWGIEDGLPVNSVYNILKSSTGYLWFSSHDGLIRFNGIDFKTYKASDFPQLKGNRIQYVAEAADSSLILQSEGLFFSRFKNGGFTPLVDLDQQKLGNGTSMGFYKDSNGDVWFGGDSGIHVFRNGTLEKFEPTLIDFPVTKITYASYDEIWFYTPEGQAVYRYNNGTITQIASNEQNSLYHSLVKKKDVIWISVKEAILAFRNRKLDTLYTTDSLTFTFLGLDADGQLSVATKKNGYFFLKNGTLTKRSTISDFGTSTGSPFLTEKDGSFWTSTRYELYKNEKLIFKSDAIIEDILKDEEGNIWIATSNRGLLKLKKKLFKTYSTAHGIPSENIYPLFQSKDSTIWIGTFGAGFTTLKDEKISSDYSTSSEDEEVFIQSFVQKNDSIILIGTLDRGVLKVNTKDKKVVPLNVPEKLQKSDVFSLFFDSKKRLWLGSNPSNDGGLFVHEKEYWTQLSGTFGIPYSTIRFIMEAPNGDIWFATQGKGIIRFDNEKFHFFSSKKGLSSDFPRALYITIDPLSKEELLWVGYEDKGLQRIPLVNGIPDIEKSTSYMVKNGLFDNSIHIILKDHNNRFWMNTNRGIFWVSISELEDFHNKKISSINTIGYTEKDGLLNREGNGGVQPAGFVSWDGSIWFPSQNGIVTFHPDSIVSNSIVPPVLIEEVSSKSRVVPIVDKQVFLSSSERDIEIDFVSLSYSNSYKNQYRFILEGFDQDWEQVGNRRIAYYTNLNAGVYTFMVQGSNNEGVWNTEGDEIKITVASLFYETIWFYLLLFFLLCILTFVSIQIRNRSFKKREKELKKAVGERTRELLDEKNKTELQANQLKEANKLQSKLFDNISHELRSPLSLIIAPLEALDSGKATRNSKAWKQQVKLMLRNSRKLLNLSEQLLEISKIESRNISLKLEFVFIHPFIKSIVQSYTEAFLAKSIHFRLMSDIKSEKLLIDKDKIEMVMGNLISNAIKFTPPGGKIRVTLRKDDKNYLIEVKDSGIGIDKEILPKIFDRFYKVYNKDFHESEGFGIGLSIVKEFVELHSGTIEVESILHIGSIFRVTIPKKGFVNVNNDTHGEPTHPEVVTSNEGSSELPVNLDMDKTTILLVDDNKDMRYFISSILIDDYKIIEANNGKNAYKKILHSLPDLIISDIVMPEMDGMKLNKLLKTNPNTAAIPFIFLTGKTERKHKIIALKEGADVYLTKPFDTEELKGHVENLISSRLRLRLQLVKNLTHASNIQIEAKLASDSFLKDLYTIMETEFSNPELSVHIIQEKLFMSRSSFYRTINEKTGLNTQQFINEYRLQKAREMLIEGKGSISEIAYACGFNSLSYFSRSFKEKFKESPSQFLKSDHEFF